MATKLSSNSTKNLRKEVSLLRSFVIGYLGKDLEGEYNPKFIKEMLQSMSDDKIEHTLKNKKSFLSYLNG